MPVLVSRRAPNSARLPARQILRIAKIMLEVLGLEKAELSVLLTDDRTIHALNREHRNKDRPTDVLAFPQDDGTPPPGTTRLLGDVVISLDTAARQAEARKRPLEAEVRFLLAHGLLHLVGYDHASPAQKRTMDALTRRLVRAVRRAAAGSR